jgi:DNA-binding response OmpR family regulator
MRILVAEDEPKVSAFLREGLEQNGYQVDVANDGAAATALASKNHYDLAILDVIMPRLRGTEVCKLIKQTHPEMPVLMLTAQGATDDKLRGFDSGTDDYLVKPFEFQELLARIKALTRRKQTVATGTVLKVADLELDIDKKLARRGGKEIALTPREYSLLEYFMRNKGVVLSRSDISDKVWNIQFDTGTNVVDVFVNMLRKKIDKEFPIKLIHTRIGLGYMMKEEA